MAHASDKAYSKENEVLFQKLGNTWYVFTEMEDDVLFSALPDGINPRDTKIELFEIIEEHMKKVAKARRAAEMSA